MRLAQQTCAAAGLIVDLGATAVLSVGASSRRAFAFHAIEKPEQIAGYHKDVPFHRPAVFKKFLEWLLSNTRVVSSGRFDAPARDSLSDGRSTAVLSFDDGFIDNYTTVFPLLKKHGTTGTFYIPTGLVNRPGGVTRAMIREMSDHGMTIGSHSVTHCKLSLCTREEIRTELIESRRYLEDLTGRECEEIAYPYGNYDERVKEEARNAGYKRAFASSPYTSHSETFAMPRISIPDTLSTWRYAAALHDAGRWRRFLGRNAALDRFVHGTLRYNPERLGVERQLR